MFAAQRLRQIPGVLPIGAVSAYRLGPWVRRRRGIPQRQNDPVRRDRRAIRELRRQAIVRSTRRDAPDLAENALQARVRRCLAFRTHQCVLQVLAVESARQEILALGLRHTALCEAQELQWICRIGRQPQRRHVEQVGVIALGVSHAAAHLAAALYEHDVRCSGRWTAQQVGSQYRSAEPAAHDGYGVAHA